MILPFLFKNQNLWYETLELLYKIAFVKLMQRDIQMNSR